MTTKEFQQLTGLSISYIKKLCQFNKIDAKRIKNKTKKDKWRRKWIIEQTPKTNCYIRMARAKFQLKLK